MDITVNMTVTVIQLWPHESECWVCGKFLAPATRGIPIYEDLILPNDYEGEWGGVDACEDCSERQGQLVEPIRVVDFIRSRKDVRESG